jgi:hypothetical protein
MSHWVAKDRNSDSYHFSIDSRDDANLRQLRETLKEENYQRLLNGDNKRVHAKLRGRGAKNKVRNRSYDYSGNVVGGLKNALRFDVYLRVSH